MKDVEKLLKESSADVLPGDEVKERVRAELGLGAQTERRAAAAHGGTFALGKNTKIALIAAALVVILTMCVVLPIVLDGGSSPVPPAPPILMSTQGDFYAYSALAAGSVLAEMNSSGALALALPSPEVQAAIRDSAEEYLRLVDGLLSGGEISHTSAEVPQKYAQYAYAMTVSGTGLGGNTLTYTLYYNENLSSEEIDGEETEREYDIEGVLSTPNGDYAVRGGRESESEYDKDESEEEEELWFNAYIGDNSYIRVEQESERESEDGEEELERSHLISLIENGKIVESTTVDLKQEDGETEVELTVKRDGAVDKLQFTRETRGGKDILYARAQFSAGDASFRVYVEDGGYRFEFVDGDEDDDFDDDDDDDDDRPYGGRH